MAHSGSQLEPASCIHVVPGSTFSLPGIRHCVPIHDLLGTGPCSSKPSEHRDLRLKYWIEFYRAAAQTVSAAPQSWYERLVEEIRRDTLGADDFAAQLAAKPTDLPVVLWTTRTWRDRLAFWWVLDAIRRNRLPRTRFWVAAPRWPVDPHRHADRYDLGHFSDDALTLALSHAAPLDAETMRQGADLWRRFCLTDPRSWDESRRTGVAVFPDLLEIARAHADLFPRIRSKTPRSLRPSQFDAFLLDPLSTRNWITPLGVMLALLKRPEGSWVVDTYGELLLAARLRTWTSFPRDEPALEGRECPQAANAMGSIELRLTARGQRLRRSGLERPSDAPPMYVGGCRLYDPRRPWALSTRGRQWQIVLAD